MDYSKVEKMNGMKISIWHVIYIIAICVIVNIFLLAICPGKVSDAAMDNISFASAIVSIVLAVVSIVYSLQSGFSSSSQLEGIKNIESNIHDELKNFKNLRDTITQSIEPIRETVGDIQKTAGDLQKAQDNLNKKTEGLNTVLTVKTNKDDISLTQTMVVALYAAALSKEKNMDIPFHIFAEYIGVKSHYIEGMLETLSTYKCGLVLTNGSSSKRKKTLEFDESKLGSKSDLKTKAEENENKHIGKDFVEAIDKYYSNELNQQAKDSVE